MSLTGKRIGHIRLESQLGAGGMGEVWCGWDEKLQRKVAVKAIHARHHLSAEVKARFLQEARVLSQLEHPHICRIHDYVEHGDSELLVLEFIDGRPLTARVAQELDRPTKLAVAEQIADVLCAAHAAGIVHRDLKPDNVMMTADGDVKVLDFGLAHSDVEIDPDELATELARDPLAAAEEAVHAAILRTEIGSVLGTPAYMSPEQARGEPIATASDCYSFGLLLQEFFSGRPPVLDGEDLESVLGRARRGERLPPEGLDKDVSELVARLTESAPAARATAVEARERLRWIRRRPKRVVRRAVVAAGVLIAVFATLKYTLDLKAANEQTLAALAKEEVARSEAELRRGQALAAQEAEAQARSYAELRQGQAEELLVYLMEDLRGVLGRLGKIGILESVADRAIEYFDGVPEQSLSTEERSRRAQAHELLADIRFEQGDLRATRALADDSLSAAEAIGRGSATAAAEREELRRRSRALVQRGEAQFYEQDYDAALETFTASADAARRVIVAASAKGGDVFQLAQAEFWIGYVHLVNLRLDEAGDRFTTYLRLSQQLVELDPANDDWHLEVAYGHSNLGSLYESQGRLDEAFAEFEESHRIRERLTASDPDNIPWKMKLGISHNKLGNLQFERLRLQEASDHFGEDLRIRTELTEHDPDNMEWQRELATAHSYLATVLRALGRTADCARHEAEDLRIMEVLLDRHPENPTWQVETAITRLRRALALLASDPRGAAAEAERAYEALHRQAADKPVTEPVVLVFLWARAIRARAQAAAGREDEALRWAAELEDRVLALPAGLEMRETAALVEHQLGLMYERAGRTADAQRAWLRCIESFADREPATVDQLVIRCSARLWLGRVTEAEPTVRRLLASGYAHDEFMELLEAKGLL